MRFRPLEVTARLGAPYAGDPAAPLDGTLLSVACARAYGGKPAFAEPGQVFDFDPGLVPLEREIFGGGDWFYKCSFAQWPEPYTDDFAYWNKRTDIEAAEQYANVDSIEIGKGETKNYRVTIPYRSSPLMRWFCVGDEDAIADLLTEVVCIGKKAAHGWGYVLEWSIKRMKSDYSIFDAEGFPTRAVPLGYLTEKSGGYPIDWPIANRGYRPPYWANENITTVVLPRSDWG